MIGYEEYKEIEKLNFDAYKLAETDVLDYFVGDNYYGNCMEQAEQIEEVYLQIKEAAVLNVSFKELTGMGYEQSDDEKWLSVYVGNEIVLNWKRIAENAKKLKVLSIRGNVSEIPESVFEISQLKILDLSDSNIVKVPQEICQLKSLEILKLDSTKIEELSEHITSLEKLKYLDISRTNIYEIPSHIKKLKNLRALRMFGDNIKDLPENFKELSKLEHLGMNHTLITSIPQSVLELKCLKAVYFGGTKIDSLPNELRALKKLEHLVIWGTAIRDLPEWITEFENLKGLYLGGTQNVKRLPKNIENLKKLEKLYINGTSIDIFPDAILELKNIKEIQLAGTKIHKLPDFSKIRRLKRLTLDDMLLERIPDSLIREELPVSLGRFTNFGISMVNTKLLCQPISLFSHDYAFCCGQAFL